MRIVAIKSVSKHFTGSPVEVVIQLLFISPVLVIVMRIFLLVVVAAGAHVVQLSDDNL